MRAVLVSQTLTEVEVLLEPNWFERLFGNHAKRVSLVRSATATDWKDWRHPVSGRWLFQLDHSALILRAMEEQAVRIPAVAKVVRR